MSSEGSDGKIKIKIETTQLELAIREMNLVSGRVEGLTQDLLSVVGMKPTLIFTAIGSLFALIRQIQQEQKEYATFIRKEKGLQTRQQYRDWQQQDRLAIRMSYRGDTN